VRGPFKTHGLTNIRETRKRDSSEYNKQCILCINYSESYLCEPQFNIQLQIFWLF